MASVKKIVLKNGLRILLVPQASSLAASVLILVEAGSEYETKKINGISHFLEHITFKGTMNRPQPGMIAEELTEQGAQFNAFTGQEYTGYWAKAEGKRLAKILEIVSDLYLNPIFNPEEIEKERGVIIEEVNMYEDTPARHVHEVLGSLLYGDQPAGWPVTGEKKVIRALMKDNFIEYRTKRYVAPATVIVVAGKYNERQTLRDIKEYFGRLPRHRTGAKVKTKERQARPQVRVQFKKSEQSHLALGFRAFNLFDERRYAIQVLADLLGGGMSSRLWKRVREELGSAYYVGADDDLSLDHGSFVVSAGVDNAKINVTIDAILKECARLRDELVSEKELKRTKDHMASSLILGLETSDSLGSFYGGQEIMTKKLLPPEAIIDRIQKVSAAEVRAVARAIFKNQGLNLAVIGPYRDGKRFENMIGKIL